MKQILLLIVFMIFRDIACAQFEWAADASLVGYTPVIENKFVAQEKEIAYAIILSKRNQEEQFRSLTIKIYVNPKTGEQSLQIKSRINRKVLIELKNMSEDELLFQPYQLKRGNNIIPFENDEVGTKAFSLRLCKPESNKSSTFLIMKQ